MRIDPFQSWVILIAVGYVGYALAKVAVSVIDSGNDNEGDDMKIQVAHSQVIEPVEETRWMKEVEDGCIVEYDEMCVHGAAYPMFEFEEEVEDEA